MRFLRVGGKDEVREKQVQFPHRYADVVRVDA